MSIREIPEDPEIAWALRTGYPSWAQEHDADDDDDGYDPDAAYDEARDARLFGRG